MDLLSLAIGKASGGGTTPTGTKEISITQNGTTTEDVSEYASAEISVSVPNPSTGTKQISITQNGTTTEDVTNYASAEISVNVSGGSNPYLTATYTSISGGFSAQFNDYKIKPKYDTEIVLWILQSNGGAPASGSATLYCYALWLVGGSVPTQNNRAQVIIGPGKTTPWSGTLSYATRSDAWSIDADGYLTAPTGTWYASTFGQTIKIYEIPLDPTEV